MTPIPTTITIRDMRTTGGITDPTGGTAIITVTTAAATTVTAIMVTATMVEDITGTAIGATDSEWR